MLSMAPWIIATLAESSRIGRCSSGGWQPALCRGAAECRNMPKAGRSRGPNLGSTARLWRAQRLLPA
eukprot:1775193-Alexandrium_andersonii.AAC.1